VCRRGVSDRHACRVRNILRTEYEQSRLLAVLVLDAEREKQHYVDTAVYYPLYCRVRLRRGGGNETMSNCPVTREILGYYNYEKQSRFKLFLSAISRRRRCKIFENNIRDGIQRYY